MTAIQPIDKKLHKNIKIKTNDLSTTADQHIVPLVIHEFPIASSQFPIIFIKDKTGEIRQSAALLGLRPNQNLFWKNKQWDATYIPAALRAQPFSLMSLDNTATTIAVCLDNDSPLINEDEGNPLFEDNNEQTTFLKKSSQFVTTLVQQNNVTKSFITDIEKLDLFVQQELSIKDVNDQSHKMTGIYRIDESRFNALSNDEFLELRKKGYLTPIYAHLSSLLQLHSLGKRSAS